MAIDRKTEPEVADYTPQQYGEYYTAHYRANRDDSPPASRMSLIKRFHAYAAQQPTQSLAVDFGAGRQVLEYEYSKYLRQLGKKPNLWLHTVDIAEIPEDKLLGDPRWTYNHQGDCQDLSALFSSESFDFGISNLVLDLAGEQAVAELYRILRPNRPLFVNLNHPYLIPANLEKEIEDFTNKINRKRTCRLPVSKNHIMDYRTLHQRQMMDSQKKLFPNLNEAEEMFRAAGFIIKYSDIKGSGSKRWWEVDSYKPDCTRVWMFGCGLPATNSTAS